MKEVFEYPTYVDFLKARILENPDRTWGGMTRLAEAISCQRSHISRVLNGQQDLTLEQGLATAQFLELSEAETEYFLLLIEKARAGTTAYRERVQSKLKKIKDEREDLSRRLNQTRIGIDEKEAVYYSAWYWSAIHILVSVPGMHGAEKIAERLQLPKALVELCLVRLAEFGLIKKEKGKWIFASGSIHLPKTSPLISVHHQNWRQRSVIDSQNPLSDGVHYTIVQSMSRTDFEKFKAVLLKAIDTYGRIAGPSEPEELVSFSCDFSKV